MEGKRLTTYTADDGRKYEFDTRLFKAVYKLMRQKINDDDFREYMGKELNVSPETIRNWLKGKNAPQDIGIIAEIEGLFGLRHYELLKPIKEDKGSMENTKENEITDISREEYEAVDRVSRSMFRYIDGYLRTTGYRWLEYASSEEEKTIQPSAMIERAEKMGRENRDAILSALHEGFIYIRAEVYDAVERYVSIEFGLGTGDDDSWLESRLEIPENELRDMKTAMEEAIADERYFSWPNKPDDEHGRIRAVLETYRNYNRYITDMKTLFACYRNNR